jgi:flagellar protein FliS
MPEKLKEYAVRVTSATPLGLTVLTFELIADCAAAAKDALTREEPELFRKYAEKARSALLQLMNALDFEEPLSAQLLRVYIYVDSCLSSAYFGKRADKLDEAGKLVRILLESFRSLPDGGEAPAMENAERIFAGLTYKNGKLGEYVDSGENRGYQA